MCTLIDEQVPIAKKPHGCNACLGVIAVGQPYARQRVVDGGDIWTWKAHLLCHAVAGRIAAEEHLDCTDGPDPDYVLERVGDLLGAALLVAS